MSADNTTLSAQVNKMHADEDTEAETAPSELVGVVDDLINQLSSKFNNLSSEMIAKMDEMSKRLDSLEATIQSAHNQVDAGDET